MDEMKRSDLSAILHSKRAHIYLLEYCRVLVRGGRVTYVTDAGKKSLYWNIPIANTTCILLGTGTSITQAAMRELARAGVLVGFSGGGGTPLFSATERLTDITPHDIAPIDIAWMSPQSEYRPTQYLQMWIAFWSNPQQRLKAAKRLQALRCQFTLKHWTKISRRFPEFKLTSADSLKTTLDAAAKEMQATHDVLELLTVEGRLTRTLYRLAVAATQYGDFTRSKRGQGTDPANRFLDHGNYLAYGLGATATWVLGLPHGLAVLHGKTRRGGLVFDAADLVKDGLVLPLAFICAMRGDDERSFRDACIRIFTDTEALDFMFDGLKSIAHEMAEEAAS